MILNLNVLIAKHHGVRTEMTIYYYPEKYDLQVIGQVDWCDESYSFELTVVWKDKTGNLLWASDAGCSCPSPFEDHNLSTLETGSKFELMEYLTNYKANLYYTPSNVDAQIVELLARV